MGIKNLNKLLKKHCTNGISDVRIQNLKNTYIAIDTSIFLYKYTYLGNLLQCFVLQLTHLLKNNIVPIYVFDGKPTEEKRDLINKRKKHFEKLKKDTEDLVDSKVLLEEKINNLKQQKSEVEEENYKLMDNLELCFLQLSDLEERICKKKKSCIRINWDDVEKFKTILTECGLFYYQCNGETDVYIKEFFNLNLIDYTITEDLDFLTHNCKNVLYGYNYRSSNLTLYNTQEIVNELDMNRESFIDMCILMGCDYTTTVKGIGQVTAHKLIKKYKTIEEIIKHNVKFLFTEKFEYAKSRNMFTQKNDINLTKQDIEMKQKENYNDLYNILKNETINIKHIELLLKTLNKNKKKKPKKVPKKCNSILKYLKKK